MDDVIQSLKRQAEWQRARSKLSWGEKLRQAVAMRESLRGFAKAAPVASRGDGHNPGQEADVKGKRQ